MSIGVSLAVIAGSLFVIAAVWIAITRRPRRPSEPEPEPEPVVVWLRPRDHRIAHAFRTTELRAELPDVEALAFCGRWPVAVLVPVADLVPDDDAPRCAARARVVARWEPGSR